VIDVQPATRTRYEVEGFDLDPLDNSFVNAHKAVEQALGHDLQVAIRVHKRIPPGSGMGGASSDAAATLKALTTMFNLKLDHQTIAEQLGSDVPFFLNGGRARAEGRGENLMPLETGRTWFAIAWPGFGLNTGDVFEAWDEVGGEGPNELRRAAGHVDERLEQFAEHLGAGWQMTGSGSAFFKAAASSEEAQRAVADLDCWKTVSASVPRWS
jgi:4-diphosphocytidyl-2-C-methyl-D-erythritol kinase